MRLILLAIAAYALVVMAVANGRGGYYNPVAFQAQGTVVELGQCSRGDCLFIVESGGTRYRAVGSPTLVNTVVTLTVFQDQFATTRKVEQHPNLFMFWKTE